MRFGKALALAALALAACGGPLDTRIDASTQEAYYKSLNSIRDKLTSEDKAKLEGALKVVAFSEAVPKEGGLFGMMAALKDTDTMRAKMLAAVNGKTPRELIAQAEAMRKERVSEEMKSIVSEIAELQAKKAGSEKAKDFLSKIVVTGPKFYWSGGYLPKPMLDFTVANNTGVALSRLFFHGIVATPGRSIPWVEHDFNYEVAGGLEPGESRHLALAPNLFSDWGREETRGRSDLVFTVAVVNAEGTDKKKLASEFGRDDEERLKKLLVMKAELEQKLSAR